MFLMLIAASAFISASAQSHDTWHKFKSDAGRFSVDIPCVPKIETEDIKGIDGTSQQVYHGCNGDGGYFIVSYVDLDISAGSKSVLDKYLDGIIKGAEATLVSDTPISLQSYPGRTVITSGRVGEADVLYNWRIYLVGKRVYGVGVATLKEKGGSPDINKFLSSFAIEK